MAKDEIATELNDPFAVLLLRKGKFPQSVGEVLKEIDAATAPDDKLRRQMSFIVGEGTQIPWSKKTASLSRGLRLAVTRGRDNEIDVLVSTAATGKPKERFLQVMGWDEKSRVFHFYERLGGAWIWAGNSTHALDARSRGHGPFDSHVNGSMVMKELKLPWNHWQSFSATVPPEVFAPDDPARKDPLFTNRSGAEVFELRVVKPGVRRWTDSRFAKTVPADGPVEQVRALMEQLFVTTTINLVSSVRESRELKPNEALDLPPTFFVDIDALTETLGLPPPPQLAVPGKIYLDALAKFDSALVEDDFRQVGDTHFAFLVPERAFEDLDVINKCLEVKLITERFVGCALMVDFPNPTFSNRRARLLRHVPKTFNRKKGSSELSDRIATAIEKAAKDTPTGSPEKEFLSLWNLGNAWKAEARKRLQAFYKAIAKRVKTPDGFDDYFQLAESRRREVRALELSENRPLLFAQTNIPSNAPLLEMGPDGLIRPKSK